MTELANHKFRSLSHTVRRLIVATAGLSLLAAGLMNFIYEIGPSRDRAAAELNARADVIAANSAAALSFGDVAQASALLDTMRGDPDILHAMLLDGSGGTVASLHNDSAGHADHDFGAWHREAMSTGGSRSRFVGFDEVETMVPVLLDGELQGYVYVGASLDRLYSAMGRYAVSSVIVLFIAMLLAYVLAGRAQRIITRPIRRLADLTTRVSAEQDFSLRAKVDSADEIGMLSRSFNEMLAQISERDVALRRHRDELEDQVAERTLKLAAANEDLERSVEEQKEARTAAEAANQSKSEFLARMSHEIRTPMNGVLGMTELLLGSELPKKERYFAKTIQQSAESLLTIINDILDFSKIEAGRLELDCVDFDLRQMIEETAELLAGQAHHKGLELLLNIDPREDYGVRGDPTRLRQVLVNLAGNAIKFTEHGQVIIKVSRAESGNWELSVSDTGIGIDESYLDSIFDVFTQEDGSNTRKFGGTGLGLAISRQLLELMNGSISVRSTRGVGSVFTLDLPLQQSESLNTLNAQRGELHGKSALIVDDNGTNRAILQAQLEVWGVNALSCKSPSRALQHVGDLSGRCEKFDFVILDMHMPEMTGKELADLLSADYGYDREQLVLLTSMSLQDVSAQAGVSVGTILTKPVRQSALYDVLTASSAASATVPALNLDEEEILALRAATNRKVLLVEDNTINRRVATMMLQRCGVDVDWCEDGTEAVHRRFSSNCDLIFMDCQMPVMDGFTATGKIREKEAREGLPRMPIVALTANAVSGDRERCLEAGMDDYLAKPFRFEDLRQMVQSWLKQADARDDGTNRPSADRQQDAIDMQVIDELRSLAPLDTDAFIESLVQQFHESATASLQTLDEALASKSCPEAGDAAHAMKSYSAHLGAVRVTALADEIERAARDDDLPSVKSFVEQLPAVLSAARAELDRIASSVVAG